MIKPESSTKVVPFAEARSMATPMPFTVELWSLTEEAPERLIGRAASLFLARAVFQAAVTEHAGRRVVLRQGSRLIEESR